MSYYLYLVETKKEYTTHLIQLLTPMIYDGILSVYEDAKKSSNEIETLKIFQMLLRKIPSWSDYIIEQETNRILKISTKGDIFEDLIKAVIKSNIMLLTNTSPENKDKLKIKHDITTNKFIHNAYIEVARNIFQNPYLFYHNYTSYQLKKNQRDANEIIKNSIIESIRKLLPINIILQNYLGTTFDNQTDNFNELMPDSEYKKLKILLNKDPYKDKDYQLIKKSDSLKNEILYDISKNNTKLKNIDEMHNKSYNQITENQITENHKIENHKIENHKIENHKIENHKIENHKIENHKTENHKIENHKTENHKTENEILNNKKNIFKNQNNLFIKDNKKNIKEKTNYSEDKDTSIPYHKQIKDNDSIEIYDNTKSNKNIKNKDEAYINYQDLMNDNSSINLKLIMDKSISSIKEDLNKKKYFNNMIA
jgi:hypothetical protein